MTDRIHYFERAGLKRGVLAGCALLGWVVSGFAQSAPAGHTYPIMHIPEEQRHEQAILHQADTQFSPLFVTPQNYNTPGSMNLLPYLPWTSSNIPQRSEANCGDCWQWASTAVLEAAHTVQTGVKDRISIQFLNSCNPNMSCCAAGDFWDTTAFYALDKYIVPWSNTNAAFTSGATGDCSSTPCGTIDTSVRYPISKMPSGITIPTQGVGQATAIANIRNVLDNTNVIYFGFHLDSGTAWNALFNWWDNNNENAVWTNFYSGAISDSGGGGHAVACVGYVTDGTTNAANSYWVMMNSWGNGFGNRPNGLFYVSMYMNYDTVDDSGYYTVFFETVTNMVYAVAPPVITSSPTSRSNLVGTTTSFAVSTAAGPPLGYHWRKNGINLTNGGNVSGATSPTLTLSNVTTNDAASYSVVLTNLYGALTNTANLVIQGAPVIVTQPQSQTIVQGNGAVLTVTATGTPAVTYQWSFTDTNNVTTTYGLGTNSFSAHKAGGYTVVVSNVAGVVTSAVANVIVLYPPDISAQPQSQSMAPGSNVVFSVTATGTAPLNYQWQFTDTNNATTIYGWGTNTFAAHRTGSYSVMVSNVAGVMMSAAATLTAVNAPQPGAFQGIARMADGTMQLNMSGAAGSNYTLEYTSNLSNWLNLTNMNASNGLFQFNDPAGAHGGQRFYRLQTGP